MANKENLIDAAHRSKSEVRENGRKGGIASGEARRKKRDLREIFEAVRDMKVQVALPDKSTKEMTFDEASALAMFKKAMNGDVNAMKLIATMLGEYEQKVKVEGATPVLVTEAEMDALSKWAKKNDEDPGI